MIWCFKLRKSSEILYFFRLSLTLNPSPKERDFNPRSWNRYWALALLLFFVPFVSSYAVKQAPLWIGGDLVLYLPSNTLNNGNSVGFNDVSNPGFGLKGTLDWAFQPTLLLGFETGILKSNINMDYWGVDKYGTIEGKYVNIPFLINAKYRFPKGDVKPFFAVLFGGNMLLNSLDYSSSYDDPQYSSYSYKTTDFKPSMAFGSGIDVMLSKKSILSVAVRYTYIADLEPTIIPIYDEFGYQVSEYVENVHGRQNYFEVTVGLKFGLGR